MKTERVLSINGMSCGACIKHVTKALSDLKGLEIKEVSVGAARVAYDPSEVQDTAVLHAVRDAGYHAEIRG
jgi:copper chaperone